jgi:hypothetical protein
MATYNTVYLWDNDRQTRTISGWDDILVEWEESMYQPTFVRAILENLKAASNWDSGKDFPLSHFLRFLDYEPNAIKWFLYEVIALRWMWGESRIDYVKELVRMVDLNSTFPVFPGSPKNSKTVRQFLENHLNEDELEYVEMPNQNSITRIGNITIEVRNDGRRIITTNSNPASLQVSGMTTPQHKQETSQKKQKEPKPATMQIRFNRESGDDDIINIVPSGEILTSEVELYNIVFKDTSVGITHRFFEMDTMGVQRYLHQVLRMSCLDEDPYQNIQLNFPGRPQVILPFNPDSYTRDLIYDCVEEIMTNWPVTV